MLRNVGERLPVRVSRSVGVAALLGLARVESTRDSTLRQRGRRFVFS
ncbi:hypothetical protein [Brunnivagina elsteri]|nr:hypothetical protein [Calothrix elsteri]